VASEHPVTASDRPDRRWGWLLLSYALPFLAWIPLVSSRRDPEVRWHAANSLLLFLALAALGIAATLVGIFVPSLSCVYAVAMGIAGVLYLGIAVLSLVKALNGERLMVPLISRHATRIARSS
jgi:uncharacterized membrane protein